MSKYTVTIECLERFTYEIEADDENYAVAEAFENRYAWECECEAQEFNVSVRAGDAE